MVDNCEAYAKIVEVLRDRVQLKFIDKKFLNPAMMEECLKKIGKYA